MTHSAGRCSTEDSHRSGSLSHTPLAVCLWCSPNTSLSRMTLRRLQNHLLISYKAQPTPPQRARCFRVCAPSPKPSPTPSTHAHAAQTANRSTIAVPFDLDIGLFKAWAPHENSDRSSAKNRRVMAVMALEKRVRRVSIQPPPRKLTWNKRIDWWKAMFLYNLQPSGFGGPC